ncbi:MAG: L,D-transpeptidase [Thermomicrobiales bacterium]
MKNGVPRLAGLGSAWVRIVALAAILAATVSQIVLQPSRAQDWAPPGTVFISSTGHTADGLFLDVWRSESGLLGDPITEELEPRSGFNAPHDVDVVQFYENLALIYLPKESADLQVQALDLGRQALETATAHGGSGALQRALEREVCLPGSSDTCATVVSSGHTVRGPFFAYWQQDGVALWLGDPLTESFIAPDGTRVQYFENGILRQSDDGSVAPLPLGKITAHKARLDTDPIEQPEDVPTYDEALFIAPEPVVEETVNSWSPGTFGPGPQQGGYKEIVVSISAEAMWAYEDGQLVNSSYVSTGVGDVPETVTPLGFHSIISKVDVQTMEGTISGQQYRVEDVPNVMYFDNLGNALHGTYWHNNFGTPMSHGCVNLPLDVAAWMYQWAPIGTPVTVIP